MASENAANFLGGELSVLLGSPINRVLSEEAISAIRARVDHLSAPDAVERMFGVELQPGKPPFDIAIHFSGPYLVVEGEPSVFEPGVNSGELVRLMLGRIRKTRGLTDLAREAARQLKVLTGFDRVMVYQFHPDGSGEVIAEVAAAGLEPFLGLHYPASDIPRQARILYQRNWLRIIADINAQPAALKSTATHSAALLDLSMSVLRSVSPIHVEYLRNMGVGASMSVSILRDGKLWGLFACHHYSPHHISFEKRTASELFGQMFSWIVEGRERESDVDYETRAHRIQERLMETAATHAHSKRAIVDFVGDYRKMIACDGIAVWSDGEITLDGETPTESEVQELIGFINRTSPGPYLRQRRDRQGLCGGRVVPRPCRRLSGDTDLAGAARLPDLLSPRGAALGQLGRRSQQILSRRAARRAADAAQEFRALAGDGCGPVEAVVVRPICASPRACVSRCWK